MTRKWKVIAPLGLAAVGALAAGIATLIKMPKQEAGPAVQAKEAPKAPPRTMNLMAGSYSFISGYKDAVTVEMTVKYDADQFSFAVVEDEFISETGDSHAAILWGEKLDMQFEYASYYNGEDFNALAKHLKEQHADLSEIAYGENKGLRFLDGDRICLLFPIPQDPYSYIIATLVKAKDNDDELDALPDYPEVRQILSDLRFQRR